VQAAGEAAARNPERQQQQHLIAAPRDDDRRGHALLRADVALPGGEPVEALERRAVRGRFEAPPVLLDGREIWWTDSVIGAGSARRSCAASGRRRRAHERGFLPPVPRSVTGLGEPGGSFADIPQ
jgi:hypothetical protein